jgi:hypothetical protein
MDPDIIEVEASENIHPPRGTEAVTVNEVEEVETPNVEDVTEDVVEEAAAPAEKKSKRPPVPAGYNTPINFAHALTARLQAEGKLAEGEDFRPQVVYSYIKNPGKTNSFPVHFMDPAGVEYEGDGEGVRPLLKVDDEGNFAEAMAWWDDKEERKLASKAKKAAAEAAKAEKASAAPKATKVAAPVEAVDEFEEISEAE